VYAHGLLHPAGSQGRDGRQAASIALFPVRAVESSIIFPDDVRDSLNGTLFFPAMRKTGGNGYVKIFSGNNILIVLR
jgi:hypothetical protein